MRYLPQQDQSIHDWWKGNHSWDDYTQNIQCLEVGVGGVFLNEVFSNKSNVVSSTSRIICRSWNCFRMSCNRDEGRLSLTKLFIFVSGLSQRFVNCNLVVGGQMLIYPIETLPFCHQIKYFTQDALSGFISRSCLHFKSQWTCRLGRLDIK